MEKHLIEYILELVNHDDVLCDELQSYDDEAEYCKINCENLSYDCVKRLMLKRMNETCKR